MVRNSPTPTMRSMAGSSDQKQRPKIAAMETGPGPCYVLPGTCGRDGHDPSRRQSPCFSFGARTKQFSSMSVSSQRCVQLMLNEQLSLTFHLQQCISP